MTESEKAKTGPIIYVEDSLANQKLFEYALAELKISNEIILFQDAVEALEFLKSSDVMPFLIFSDVNMPKMNGFDFKREIEKNKELSLKAIPFIYLSASASRRDVKEAFYHQAQGYFEKPADLDGLIKMVRLIIEYWSNSELPRFYL